MDRPFFEDQLGIRLQGMLGFKASEREVRIRCRCPSGANDELELIGRLAADLGELTAPISDDR